MSTGKALIRFCAAALFAIPMLIGVARPALANDILVVRDTTGSAQAERRLSEADLLALRQVTFRTRTEFTDGIVEFSGPLAREALGPLDTAQATILHLVAANDYSIDIPMRDVLDYDVILALYANGKRLSIRDKGPIWLMYPLDEHPELQDSVYNARLIWQLALVEIR